MRVKVPLYRTSCLLPLVAVLALFVLVACATTITSKHADGSETTAKVGYGSTYNTKTGIIESDPRIIDATAKGIVIVAKEAGPEIIDRISKNALEAQKQQQQ